MKAIVASSHYQENLDWTVNCKYPTIVYSKTISRSPNFIPFNKVQEVPAYLKYIIDNYKTLPEHSVFVHGHRSSNHQVGNIDDIINSIKFGDKKIINLNRPDWYQVINQDTNEWDKKYTWLSDNWKTLFKDTLPLPIKLGFWSSAQFAVHKDCILQYPMHFWSHLYKWCMKTTLENYVSARIFEYTWYYIFSKRAMF